jgi:hypothetical protein
MVHAWWTLFYYRPVLALALLACIASILAVLYYKKAMGTIAITISSIYMRGVGVK